MMKREINEVIRSRLAVNGFVREHQVWCRDSDELYWRVNLESLPHWRKVEVELGCTPRSLAIEAAPTRTNDCLIVHSLSNLPLKINSPEGKKRTEEAAQRVRDSLNIDSAIDDSDRVMAIEGSIDAMARLVDAISSEADLKDWIIEEEADQRGFVHRSVKEHLNIPFRTG